MIPRNTRVEKFGSGRFRSKIFILLLSTALLTLGAAFRVGINYMNPRPRNDPAWYHSKACFYIFNFTVELLVIILYIVVRVDTRFFVPNGSRQAGDYSSRNVASKKISDVSLRTAADTIMSEGTVFDEAPEKDEEHEKFGQEAGEKDVTERKRNAETLHGENAV